MAIATARPSLLADQRMATLTAKRAKDRQVGGLEEQELPLDQGRKPLEANIASLTNFFEIGEDHPLFWSGLYFPL